MRKPKILLAAHEVSFIKSGLNQQQLTRVLGWGAILTIVALAVVSLVFAAKSRQAAEEARKIATTSFVRTIGSSYDDSLSKEELNALWDLAELRGSLEPVRITVIEQWFTGVSQFRRADSGNGRGLRAAVGISSNRTNMIAPLATELVHKTVEAMDKAEHPDAFVELGLALGRNLPPEAAAIGAERLVAAIEKPEHPDILPGLGSALGRIGGNLPSEIASKLAERLVVVMENTDDSLALPELGYALGRLGGNLPPEIAAKGAERWVAAMEGTDDSRNLSGPRSALGGLGGDLSFEQAAKEAERLVAAMEKLDNSYANLFKLSELGSALGRIGGNLPSEIATKVAERLVVVMENTYDPEALSRLGYALGRLGENLPSEISAKGAERLVTVIEKTEHPYPLYELGHALGSLGGNLSSEQAAKFAKRLVAAMEETDDPRTWSGLASALGHLGGCLPKSIQISHFAMSNMLIEALPEPSGDGDEDSKLRRVIFKSFCASRTPQQLAEILKWPLCVGEAEGLVLAEMEQQLSKKRGAAVSFGGKLSKFIDQAESLGITNLDGPAQRPTAKAALAELERLFPPKKD